MGQQTKLHRAIDRFQAAFRAAVHVGSDSMHGNRPRIGLIGVNNQRGLGCQNRQIARELEVNRWLLPTFAVAVGVIALLAAWAAPGRDSDAVRVPLIAAVLIVFTLLLIWLLRPLGPTRKIVSLGLLWLVGLPMLVWRLSSMG